MSDGKRLTETLTVRLPKELMEAMTRMVLDKEKDFPRYNHGDLVRIALVNHLKEKGYLDKKKDYL